MIKWKQIDSAPRNVVCLLYSREWGVPLVGWIEGDSTVWMAVGNRGRMSPRNAGQITHWAEVQCPDGVVLVTEDTQ